MGKSEHTDTLIMVLDDEHHLTLTLLTLSPRLLMTP